MKPFKMPVYCPNCGRTRYAIQDACVLEAALILAWEKELISDEEIEAAMTSEDNDAVPFWDYVDYMPLAEAAVTWVKS